MFFCNYVQERKRFPIVFHVLTRIRITAHPLYIFLGHNGNKLLWRSRRRRCRTNVYSGTSRRDFLFPAFSYYPNPTKLSAGTILAHEVASLASRIIIPVVVVTVAVFILRPSINWIGVLEQSRCLEASWNCTAVSDHTMILRLLFESFRTRTIRLN